MNAQIFKTHFTTAMTLVAVVVATNLPGVLHAAPPVPKCTVDHVLDFDPGNSVVEGTEVFVTQFVDVATVGKCGLAVGDPVNDGNAQIKAIRLGDDGEGRPCADLGKAYCTVGISANAGNECFIDADCVTEPAGSGICTAVVEQQLAHSNPFDGEQSVLVDTTGLGYSLLGFKSQYSGNNEYEGAVAICSDLEVLESEDCSGALISIERASGPGFPAAPGGPYDWSFEVTVHACEDLYGVSAQGGTNGWAQLVGRSEDSLHPSNDTTAEIRKANKKTDVILWTIGDMTSGQEETLVVDLRGSIKGAPDCQERFLSGAWSSLFSIDGFVFEKSDYTGRVSVFTDSNGNPDDCL